VIVDSGSDRTTEIAQARSAQCCNTAPLSGAYIDATRSSAASGWSGDADCTYDFRQLDPSSRSSRRRVVGSMEGTIEPDRCRLHRRLGTPITTWVLNLVYRSHFSDIHCGMRGITPMDRRIDLQSQS
jgi:hypothetical protein